VADDTLDILIRLGSDTTGGQQVLGTIKETTEATKKGHQANEENEKGVLSLGHAHRELHQLMHRVTEQSPLMGLAMRAAMSPQGAAIMAVVAAFHELNKAEEESGAKAKEASEANASSYGTMEEPIRNAIKAAQDAQAEFAKWTQQQKEDLTEINRQLDLETTKIKGQIEIIKQVIAAEKEREEARLKQQLARGEITPEQYDTKRAALEGGARQAPVRVDEAALVAEIEARKKALDETKKRHDEAEARANAAEAQRTSPEAQMRDAHQSQLADQAAKAKQKADEAAGKIAAGQEAGAEAMERKRIGPTLDEAFSDIWHTITGQWNKTTRGMEPEKELERLDAEKRREEEMHRVSAAEADRLQEQRKKEQDALDEAKRQAAAYEAQRKEQEAALARAQAQLDAKKQGSAQTTPIVEQTAFMKFLESQRGRGGLEDAAEAARAWREGEDAKRKRSQGKQLTAEEQREIEREDTLSPALKALVQAMGDKLGETVQQILADNHVQFKRAAELVERAANQNMRVFDAAEARIRQVEDELHAKMFHASTQ
jgi:hypothetical protein